MLSYVPTDDKELHDAYIKRLEAELMTPIVAHNYRIERLRQAYEESKLALERYKAKVNQYEQTGTW